MRSPRRRWRPPAAAALALTLAAVPASTLPPTPPPLLQLTLVEPKAEVAASGARWRQALEGTAVPLGGALRLGPDAVARLELPWMALTLGAGARLRFPNAFLLAAVLENGRALVESETRDSLKVVTAEAEVRGRGRAVVRRRERATLVTCLSGRFYVASGSGSVWLGPGQGSIAVAGRPPGAPETAPAAPEGLWPGRDAVYVGRGEPIVLRWEGDAPGYQLELMPVTSDVVLLQRDVDAAPARITVPWHGAYRWRVSARDERGLEGPPSEEGLIAVE